MNPIICGNGELPLLSEDTRVVAFDALEQWQIDQMSSPETDDSCSYSISCLMNIDKILTEWLQELTPEEWNKIKKQRSLFGIKLPEKWIKVWRFILKEPSLRDSERATSGGKTIGSFTHLWNLWAEDCIEKYLDDLDKELLFLVGKGLLYNEIGDILLSKYKDDFWIPRDEKTKTTPAQVVNNYLYWKMPNKIARGEITSLILAKLKYLEKNKKKESCTK